MSPQFPPPPPPPSGGSRAGGPPVPPDYFERFVSELEGIRRAVEMTNQLIPEKISDAAKELASFYERGYSSTASRAGSTVSGADALGPELQGFTADLRAARAALQDASTGGAGLPPRRPRSDEREEESGGFRGGRSTPPRVTLGGDPFAGLTQEHLDRGYLDIPRSQGGQFNVSDFLGNISSYLGRAVAKSKAGMEERGENPYDSRRLRAGGYAQKLFEKSANEWAPQITLNRQYLQKIGAPVSGLEAYGTNMNVPPTGGDIGIGPFGFRTPFNPAVGAGLRRQWDITKDSFGAGITKDQAAQIRTELEARGFTANSNQTVDQAYYRNGQRIPDRQLLQSPRASFGEMHDAAKWMQQRHPQLLNSEYYDLKDKATRGGAASVKEFVANMSQVEKVAKDTGYSFKQLQADMDAVGTTAQGMGGTHFEGQSAAVNFQGITKISASQMPQLMQNPWVQTQALQRYGMMPWEMGAMTGGQWANSIVGSVSQMNKLVGPMQAHKIDVGHGFTRTISSQEEREMMISQQMGIPRDKVHQMLHEANTVKARGNLEDEAEVWSRQMGAAGRAGNKGELGRLMGSRGRGDWKALHDQMVRSGFTKKEIGEVEGIGKDDHHKGLFGNIPLVGGSKHHMSPQEMASERYRKIRDIVHRKDQVNKKDAGPSVTIKLDDKAQKRGFFFDNKSKARAGQGSVNVPFSGGPSPEPSGVPDMPFFDPSAP